MKTVGHIRGMLVLRIDDSEVNLGEVSIPLAARTVRSVVAGSPEIAVELKADLEKVRGLVQDVLRWPAQEDS